MAESPIQMLARQSAKFSYRLSSLSSRARSRKPLDLSRNIGGYQPPLHARTSAVTHSIQSPKYQQYTLQIFRQNLVRQPRTCPYRLHRQNFHTTPVRPLASGSTTTKEGLSLGQRMRKLSKEYGWSAVGVYFLLSALDFPFCYLLVKTLGTDLIGEWEHAVVTKIQQVIPESVVEAWRAWRTSVKEAEREVRGNSEVSDHVEMVGWGVEEADAEHKKNASLATQLALAYAIHKSFIFIRVPLAAALTPRVVKVLRGWGWNIGKGKTATTKSAAKTNRE